MKSLSAMLIAVALLPSTLSARPDEEPPPRITVSGHGTVDAEPDRAVLQVGVLAQRASAREAEQEASRIARAILDRMLAIEVPETAAQTSTLDLQPVYSQRRPQQQEYVPEVIAFRAANTIRVTLDDLDLIGPALEGAIEAGANRIQGLTFSIRDDAAAQASAVQSAVDDAAAKAGAIAAALGRQLGPVLEVQEGGVRLQPVYARRAFAEMAADPGPPVASGQVTVTASVTVVYSLAD